MGYPYRPIQAGSAYFDFLDEILPPLRPMSGTVFDFKPDSTGKITFSSCLRPRPVSTGTTLAIQSPPLLPRAERLAQLATRELARRSKILEIDNSIEKITLEFIIDKHSGDAKKIRYLTSSVTDLDGGER